MFSRMPNEPDMDTLTYWVTRLEPLIRKEGQDEIIVVFCNRTGTEDDVVYAGTSAVVGIHDGEVKIYGLLGRGEKELLVVDTNNPPYAKLVYRPEPERPSAVHSELQQTGSSPSSTNASIAGSTLQQGGLKHGFSSHTPTQPTSPPSKSSSASVSSQKSQRSSTTEKAASKSLSSRLAHAPPNIKIPLTHAALGSLRDPQADSPGSESVNLPTPTAPSPTPLAIRPRLIIPQSPPAASWQSASPVPLSSHSIRSVQSHHSTRSDLSVQSNSTITSNPRPPEDSTPYPLSGAPLSGYPTKPFERRIYGGSVSISQLPFTPITPFDEHSPQETRYFWRPSDTALKSPMDSWPRTAVAEPDETRTQSFHFPLFHGQEPRAHSSNSIRTATTAKKETTKKDGDKASKDRKRALSQNARVRQSSKSRSNDARGDPATSSSSQEDFPARPSSPKSRNASRSRTHERSNSAMAHREHATIVSQQLESISKRAESVNRNRNLPGSGGTPQPDRPSSPKSRNCSRSRPSEALSSILIAASPSILGDEQAQALAAVMDPPKTVSHRPSSRMSYRARAGSALDARPSSRASVAGEPSGARSSSRAPSRGRQPGPNFSPPKMSPYDPSAAAGPSSDEIVRIQRDRKSSIGSKPPAEPSAPAPNFQRVESVVCPTCPLHGRHSTSSAPVPHSSIQSLRSSPDLNSGRSMSSPAAANGVATTDVVLGNQANSPQFSVTPSSKPSDVSSLAETIETISTTSRSPSTPFFEPKTPKAMVILRDAEAGSNGSALPALSDDLIDLSCVDIPMGPTPDGSVAIAT